MAYRIRGNLAHIALQFLSMLIKTILQRVAKYYKSLFSPFTVIIKTLKSSIIAYGNKCLTQLLMTFTLRRRP